MVYDAVISALLGSRLGWQRSERTEEVDVLTAERPAPARADGPLPAEQAVLLVEEHETVGATGP